MGTVTNPYYQKPPPKELLDHYQAEDLLEHEHTFAAWQRVVEDAMVDNVTTASRFKNINDLENTRRRNKGFYRRLFYAVAKEKKGVKDEIAFEWLMLKRCMAFEVVYKAFYTLPLYAEGRAGDIRKKIQISHWPDNIEEALSTWMYMGEIMFPPDNINVVKRSFDWQNSSPDDLKKVMMNSIEFYYAPAEYINKIANSLSTKQAEKADEEQKQKEKEASYDTGTLGTVEKIADKVKDGITSVVSGGAETIGAGLGAGLSGVFKGLGIDGSSFYYIGGFILIAGGLFVAEEVKTIIK